MIFLALFAISLYLASAEVYYERDFPRRMAKWVILSGLLCAAGIGE